jgi:cathepsin A (carboxypeptidase C)
MRLLPATLLVGAASAATSPFQQVMGVHQEQLEDVVKQGSDAFKHSSDAFSKPLEQLKDHFKTLSGEARELWEEVSNYFPNSMDHAPMLSLPKKHTRRPSSHWDHIVSGKDVQSIWVSGADGTKEREIDGKLEAYDLRVKKVDPSSLGVDPNVKQYSGYLDDNENDKHLFYCEFNPPYYICLLVLTLIKGSSSLVMTPRMTQSSSG